MANGGGSRIGGFFRGALTGLVVCAIAAVALSLSAPVPERTGSADGVPADADGAVLAPGAAPGAAPGEAPGAVESTAPPAAAPAEQGADVTVVPAEEPAGASAPPAPAAEDAAEDAAEESVAPQPTFGAATPEGDPEAPASAEDTFTAPSAPTR